MSSPRAASPDDVLSVRTRRLHAEFPEAHNHYSLMPEGFETQFQQRARGQSDGLLSTRAPHTLNQWASFDPRDRAASILFDRLVVDAEAERAETEGAQFRETSLIGRAAREQRRRWARSGQHSIGSIEGYISARSAASSTGSATSFGSGAGSVFEHGQSSACSTSTNFVNTVVGAGIVGLPYVFRIAGGIAPAIALMIFGCLLTDYSVRLLVRTGIAHDKRNYEDLCQHALGPAGHRLVSATMLIFDFGAMLTYLIIMGDAAETVVGEVTGRCGSDARRASIMALSCIVILPLCLLRDVSQLERASGASCLTVILIIGIVWLKALDFESGHLPVPGPAVAVHDASATLDAVARPERRQLFMAFGIVAFAFVCHDSAFLLFNTLSRNTAPGRWAGVVHRSLCAALIVCLGLAVPGFLTFGASTCDNLLKNYEAGDPWIVAARAVYVLTMALTYPISFFVVRHIVNVWAYGGGPRFESVRTMPLSRHLALTLPLFVLSVGAAMLFEDLGPVMAVAGSLGGCTLAFILPPMCYLTLSRQSLLVWRNPNPWASLCDLGPPTCLLLFGLFMAPVCVWQTLASETLPCASAKHSGCPPK